MRTAVEPLEGNKVKLSVELDDQEFGRALEQAARKLSREVRMPGFRPGKVPRRVLEAKLGAGTLRQEALREALPDFYADAVRETELDVIAAPEIDINDAESGPVSFDAVVEVRPTVAIPGYNGLQVTLDRPEASDEDVRRQVDRLRGAEATLVDVDRPAQDGDNVNISIRGTRDGEPVDSLTTDDFLYEVGSEGVVAELDANLRGATVGAELSFAAALPGGGELQLEVGVKEVKEKVLPELTDAWVGSASEFSTVAEFEADIRKRITSIKKVQASMQLRQLGLAALVELVAEDAPEALVESEVESSLRNLAHRLEHQGADVGQYLAATGQDGESFIASVRQEAVESVKADLALRALAEAEGLDADESDIDNEIARVAEAVNRPASEVRRDLARSDGMQAVRSDVRKSKALEWLLAHVTIVDPEGQPIDRGDLQPELPSNESAENETAESSDAGASPEETQA